MRTYRLIILTLFIGCKAAAPTSESSDVYTEDLSALRPTISEMTADADSVKEGKIEKYVPLTGHIKVELDSISKISRQKNREGKMVDGFVIQIYSGGSREEASEVRNNVFEHFSDLKPKLIYIQPTFRVVAGQFADRLEANRVYETVKKEFPRSLLIPERFRVVYE